MSEYVLASEDAYLKADATAVSVSLSIGGAIGVAVVNNRVHSDIAAWIANALVASTNTTIQADANTRIQKTTTAAISAALYAGAGNESEAEIATQVSAYVDAATLVAMGDVAIRAMADNYARADGFGGAFGGYAVGALVSDIVLGRGNKVDEVTAALRGAADVGARSLTIEATSTDDLLSESIAASAAYIGVAGAQANVANDLATLAQIGDSSDVLVTSLVLRSTHEQESIPAPRTPITTSRPRPMLTSAIAIRSPPITLSLRRRTSCPRTNSPRVTPASPPSPTSPRSATSVSQ